MQYSPKLKKAMQEIQEILDRNDIAGVVVLHEPNFCEYLQKVNPSYSCAKPENNGIRLRAKLQEDFNGDRKAWTKKVRDTSNMFRMISETLGNTTLNMIDTSLLLDKVVDAKHDSGNHTSHTQQNN